MKVILQDSKQDYKKEFICVGDVIIEINDLIFKLRSGNKGLIIFKIQGKMSKKNYLSNDIDITEISKDTILIS